MPPIETLEGRKLFAPLVADASFGNGGDVSLPRNFGNSVLATHGGVYVEGFNARRNAFFVYKYTDAGELDTSWGDGGSMRPTITRRVRDGNTSLKMVYDTRTDGLLLTLGSGRTLSVERLTVDGKTDTAWGTGGVVQYTARRANVAVGEVLPMTRKRLAVAFKTIEQNGLTYDGKPMASGATDVYVAQFDRLGRLDKTFNRGRPVLAFGGHRYVQEDGSSDSGSRSVESNEPSVSDLQKIDDGFRLVSLREKSDLYALVYDDRQGSSYRGRTDWWLDTLDISASGGVSPAVATRLYRNVDQGRYTPLLAVATGDDVAVLSTLQTTDNLKDQPSVTRFRDGKVVSTQLLGGGSEDAYNVIPTRNTDGTTFVRAYTPTLDPYYLRLDADFVLKKRFDPQTATPFDVLRSDNQVPDDEGRLVVLSATDGGARTLVRLT